MRIAVAFGLLGMTVAASAILESRGAGGLQWILVAIEGLLAASFLALSAVYVLAHVGFATERAFLGRGPARAAILPYQVAASLLASLARRMGRESPMDAVAPGLYVGRLPHASDGPRLGDVGVDAILSLCAEFPAYPHPSGAGRIESFRVPVLDGMPPAPAQFEAAIDWVVTRRAEGKAVLIHCAQGHGRSVVVAAAALVRLGLAPGPEDALALIQSARPKAHPSRAQVRALEEFLAR